MTDYERGIRDAFAFYGTHTLRYSTINGEQQVSVIHRPDIPKQWPEGERQLQIMTEAAVAELAKEAAR